MAADLRGDRMVLAPYQRRPVKPISRWRLVWQVFKAHYRRTRRHFGPVRAIRIAWVMARAFSRSLDRRKG